MELSRLSLFTLFLSLEDQCPFQYELFGIRGFLLRRVFFAWEAPWGKVLTLDQLQRRGWNALTDPQRARTPAVSEYWKPLAEDMDLSAGIEAEYHHKNNRVDGLTHKHLGSIGLHSI
ncbi:THO complex subunit 1 [Vitis vinifera]|uniref:THO complex subunit 1 n=1 Tax=Vitis vinifera TaxID=29760 RepID=A0A438IJY6_VITVI|nr:THO complex subunit 1 [Vitis vinifera]